MVMSRCEVVAISLPRYGCYLVIYIHPLYCLRCHICGSVTSRRLLHTGFQRRLSYYTNHCFSSGLGSVSSFFAIYCRHIRVTRMLLLIFCGPGRRLVNRFFSKTRHSFDIYLRRNIPHLSTPTLQSRTNNETYAYAVSSPQLLHLPIALQLAIIFFYLSHIGIAPVHSIIHSISRYPYSYSRISFFSHLVML